MRLLSRTPASHVTYFEYMNLKRALLCARAGVTVSVRACAHVFMCTYVCVYKCVCVCMCVYIRTSACVHTSVWVRVCKYVFYTGFTRRESLEGRGANRDSEVD